MRLDSIVGGRRGLASRVIRAFRLTTVLPLAALAAAGSARAQSAGIVLDTVASGLGRTTAMVFVSDDTALVMGYAGPIDRIDIRSGRLTRVTGTPSGLVAGEASMKDFALHPDFATNHLIYISLVVGERQSNRLAVVRGRLEGDALRDTTTVLITAASDSGVDHYGGQILFKDGYLFVSNGDRQNRARVQDLAWHHGKVLRVDADGRAPSDNPFVNRPGARPEIWSFGHRNVQGMAYDSVRGILWANEHGPRHGDELNIVERGLDYGWPRVSWGWEYEGGPIGAGVPVDSVTGTPPWVWSPNVAPSGLLVYSGRAFPAWRGSLFVGTMQAVRGRHLNRLVWDGERIVLEERLFPGTLGRVRYVTEDSRGWIYLGNDDGQVLRLRPR